MWDTWGQRSAGLPGENNRETLGGYKPGTPEEIPSGNKPGMRGGANGGLPGGNECGIGIPGANIRGISGEGYQWGTGRQRTWNTEGEITVGCLSPECSLRG